MNNKSKTAFVCNSCGQEYGKWLGKCSECGTWGSITEFRVTGKAARSRSGAPAKTRSAAAIRTLSETRSAGAARVPSLFGEVDRVLGGGLVPGAMVLIGGDPGIGKSTLLLQMVAAWSGRGLQTLYVSGEESYDQISLRAARLGVSSSSAAFLAETSVDEVCSRCAEFKPRVVVIDSIQTMMCEGLESAPGTVSQIRESAAALLRFAKENGTAIFLVGHVTKEGSLAGPRLLEHMVDTVLYFEGDANYQYRILRAVKNRYGPSGEIAVLSMSDKGFAEITNASELFLHSRDRPQVGIAVVPVLEGSRVLVVELQTLVNRTHFGLPQRVASGINPKKLALLIAVLERHGNIMLGDHDIFFNIAGGLSVPEPAIDLGIVAAICSSFRNKPIAPGTALLGEVGLGGEIRPVNNMAARIKELQKLNFSRCIVPKPQGTEEWIKPQGNNRLIFCNQVSELQDLLFNT